MFLWLHKPAHSFSAYVIYSTQQCNHDAVFVRAYPHKFWTRMSAWNHNFNMDKMRLKLDHWHWVGVHLLYAVSSQPLIVNIHVILHILWLLRQAINTSTWLEMGDLRPPEATWLPVPIPSTMSFVMVSLLLIGNGEICQNSVLQKWSWSDLWCMENLVYRESAFCFAHLTISCQHQPTWNAGIRPATQVRGMPGEGYAATYFVKLSHEPGQIHMEA